MRGLSEARGREKCDAKDGIVKRKIPDGPSCPRERACSAPLRVFPNIFSARHDDLVHHTHMIDGSLWNILSEKAGGDALWPYRRQILLTQGVNEEGDGPRAEGGALGGKGGNHKGKAHPTGPPKATVPVFIG